ncbi:MAG: hypothetical protein HUU30_20135 [Burkholderiaceae bacterium]|nr:hypothetical protein [Aquabacterium sp.]NUP88036.1 hypothetical protein [Burkholderiaceae bacterium]
MPRKNHHIGKRITIELPPEFIELCRQDNVAPELVLRGFIADLCEIVSWCDAPRTDGYASNGSDERRMAREYYERVGYPWLFKPN